VAYGIGDDKTYYQLLSRVVTGIENDHSVSLAEDIMLDDKQEKQNRMDKRLGNQLPHELQFKIPDDSMMFSMSAMIKKIVLPRNDKDKGELLNS